MKLSIPLILLLQLHLLASGAFGQTGGGVSPGKLTHWATQWVFKDAFKHSMPWRSNDENRPLQLDDNGWVTRLEEGQFAWTLIHSKAAPHYPGGRYHVTWEGKGDLRFSKAARVLETAEQEMLIEVDPSRGGIRVELHATASANPLRELQLLPEALAEGAGDEGSPFHPRFLKLLRGFEVIRFSHLMSAGGSERRTWETRVTPDSQTQAGKKGLALEYAIALCNELLVDAWFTIPVNTRADYQRQFAQLVREQLRPGLRVYVEYGDDVGVWPTASSQFCIQRGRELGLSDDWNQSRNRFYARRSDELFTIWNEIFGDGDDSRLITVLNPISDEVCEMAARGADAAGMVTLFGEDFGKLENIDHLLLTDLDELMTELEAVATVDANKGLITAIDRARRFDLEPVSFYMTPVICPLGDIESERGEDVLAAVRAKTLAMLEHPRMEPILRRYIQSWRDAGGGLWIHEGLVHEPSQWGWFGLLKHMEQPVDSSPRFRAVRAELGPRPSATKEVGPGVQPYPVSRAPAPISLQSDVQEKVADPLMGSAAGWTVRLDLDGYFPDEDILVSVTSPDFWKQGPGAFITKPPYLNGKPRQDYHRVYIRPTGEEWTEQMVTVVPDADGKLDLTCYVVAPGAMNIVHWDELRADGATLRNGSFEEAGEDGLPLHWRQGGWSSEAPEGEYRTGRDDAAAGEDYVTASWTHQWITTLTDVKKDQPIVLRWKTRFIPPETRYPVRVGVSGLGLTDGDADASLTTFRMASGMQTDSAAPERYVGRLLDGFELHEGDEQREIDDALGIYLAQTGPEWTRHQIRHFTPRVRG